MKHELKTGIRIVGLETLNFLALLQLKENIYSISGIVDFIIQEYKKTRTDIVIPTDEVLVVERNDIANKFGRRPKRLKSKTKAELEAEVFEKALKRMERKAERKEREEANRLAKELYQQQHGGSFDLGDYLF